MGNSCCTGQRDNKNQFKIIKIEKQSTLLIKYSPPDPQEKQHVVIDTLDDAMQVRVSQFGYERKL